ncbi:MAG: hypothetical protein HQ581_21965, partial [Planctomycetes bacterium]|nr:hypothetical protein [Planctomycetota bacterium]
MATLLGRAGNVFSLARELGQKFQEEGQSRAIYYDPSIWDRLRPTFDEFWAALLDLRDAMQRPPDGFEAVADQLKTAAKIARGIQAAVNPKPEWESWSGRTVGKMFAVKDPGPPEFTAYLDFFPQLNTVAYDGWQAVKQAKKAQRLDDPFAFVDDPTNGSTAEQPWTLLDRFPATPDGHIAFLEFVRDEVHNAADAKRQRLAREYTNATIE